MASASWTVLTARAKLLVNSICGFSCRASVLPAKHAKFLSAALVWHRHVQFCWDHKCEGGGVPWTLALRLCNIVYFLKMDEHCWEWYSNGSFSVSFAGPLDQGNEWERCRGCSLQHTALRVRASFIGLVRLHLWGMRIGMHETSYSSHAAWAQFLRLLTQGCANLSDRVCSFQVCREADAGRAYHQIEQWDCWERQSWSANPELCMWPVRARAPSWGWECWAKS